MITPVFRGLDGLPLQPESVERGQWMRMQAGLCGLIAMDALLLVKKTGHRPGKARERMLVILVPERALGGRSMHKAGSNV